MAKVSYTKLGLKPNTETKTVIINDQEVEVKQYLPIQDKLNVIANVVNNSQDENNFKNLAKVEMFTDLEILKAYTNINFTDKQMEEPWKIYDVFAGTGFMETIRQAIPVEEYGTLIAFIDDATERIYNYRNSAYGILDAMSTDYSALDFDAEALKEKISNGENVEFLKDVLTKLG